MLSSEMVSTFTQHCSIASFSVAQWRVAQV